MKLSARSRQFDVSLRRHWDLSIPISDSEQQLQFFNCFAPTRHPLQINEFIGDTTRGGSCNVSQLTIVPHCHGTHTECVGHISDRPYSIQDIDIAPFLLARVLSVQPTRRANTPENVTRAAAPDDRVLTADAFQAALTRAPRPEALIVRTLPNERSKRTRDYVDSSTYPYFTEDAMTLISASKIEHLLVDTPSLDRADDGGHLNNHRIWWGLPATRKRARYPKRTISELLFVPAAVRDGDYALNLQVAPLPGDAAPARPLLFPLRRRRAQ